MKHLLSAIFLFFFTGIFFKTEAQQKHFIYIESEGQQPFAVVMNGKVYSSSDYGYVIIPKLSDGNYSFTVSFPLNKFPDQNFKCVISKKDLGYKLSNASGGWALQNMQTQKNVAANTTSANNDFSNMLSDVVNDSNLTNKNIAFNKPDTVAALTTKIDSNNVASAVTTADSNSISSSTINPANNNVSTDSVAQLQKISQTKQDTGTNMVFVDRSSGNDTISVFVPFNDSLNNTATATADSNFNQQQTITKTSNAPANETSSNAQNADTTSTTFLNSSSENVDTTTHAVDNPFYKSTTQNNNTTVVTPVTTNQPVANENSNNLKATNAVNELCVKMISDNDLDKLKRKMFVQNNDNNMVQTAVKFLSNKCITTEQVKELGNIFSSDDGRYSLYDALYKNVYDYGNYSNLGSQIIDPYYKRRFEAMLK